MFEFSSVRGTLRYRGSSWLMFSAAERCVADARVPAIQAKVKTAVEDGTHFARACGERLARRAPDNLRAEPIGRHYEND